MFKHLSALTQVPLLSTVQEDDLIPILGKRLILAWPDGFWAWARIYCQGKSAV